jgi:alkaline phosphatase D
VRGPGAISRSARAGSLAFLPLVVLAAAWPLLAQPEQPRLAAGPMVGHVSDSSARVWVQLEQPAAVSLELRPAGTTEWQALQGPYALARARPDRRLAVTLTASGLAPATLYEYRLTANGQPLSAATEQSFRTPPLAGEPEDLRIAFGSCIDADSDPDPRIFAAAGRLRPDVFLFIGDNVYFGDARAEWDQPELMWERYRQGRALASLQPLLRRTASYATWDDHDFGPNDSDKLYPYRDVALSIFSTYWANPAYGSGGAKGVWYRFTRGRVELFVLDNRYHRDPRGAPDDEHKSQLGPEQRAWLQDVLPKSRATFKILVSGGQVLSRYHPFESFDEYRHERQWLLGLIERHRIAGVVLLSGDRHLGEVLRWMPPEVPYPLYELTSSPLSAGIASTMPPPDAEVPERLPGSLVRVKNFGELLFSEMGSADPRLVLRLRGEDGEPLGTPLELRASELRAAP